MESILLWIGIILFGGSFLIVPYVMLQEEQPVWLISIPGIMALLGMILFFVSSLFE